MSGAPIVIDRRCAGFPGISLGGYAAGLMTRGLRGAEVRFRQPIPVETALDLDREADISTLSADGRVLAEGRAAKVDVDPIPAVPLDAALEATHEHLGKDRHLFPTCFCCGPANSERDGLRVFVGRIPGSDAVAGVWTGPVAFAEGGILPDEIAWSAVDCPAIWALIVGAPRETSDHVVTGTLAVEVTRPLRAGERYIVVAWPLGREGRRLYAGTAICDERGGPLVIAKQTCVVTQAGVPLAGSVWFPA